MKNYPKFKIYRLDDFLGEYVSLEYFWLKITEARIMSIDKKLLKKLINMDEHIDSHVKFLKKLQSCSNSKLFEKHFPKYIVRMTLANSTYKSVQSFYDESDENKVLTMMDNMVGKDAVKICSGPGIIQLEVWLKDDDDLSAFEFYTLSNKELFFG